MSFWYYFPLNLKNFWIYKVAEKYSSDYVITKVVINEKIPFSDKVIYILTYYVDDEEIKRESFVIQSDGIYLYARKVDNNLIVFDPLLPFLPYNFLEIDWWSWEGKAGMIPTKIFFKNKKIVEENVIKIEYTEENKFGKSQYIVHLKKDVGMIREEAETPFLGYVSEVVDYEVSFDDFSFINFKTVEYEVINEKDNEFDFQEEIYSGLEEEFFEEPFEGELENEAVNFNEEIFDEYEENSSVIDENGEDKSEDRW